jgi:hypothetical protein
VGNIVDSLFADYLPRRQQEPMRVADPRQQTMLTNQMLTPVMNKPVTPPNNYSINPPVNPLRSEFTQPTTQPPVVNNRPIYSNNPPIAPDYGFTQPTQPPAPISNQTLTPVIPKPTPPTRDVPLFPSVGGIGVALYLHSPQQRLFHQIQILDIRLYPLTAITILVITGLSLNNPL